MVISIFKNSRPEVFCEKGVIKILQNSPENTCARASFLIKLLVAASVFFQSILLVLTKFSCWQENWALAYHSMIAVGFLCSKPLGGSKFINLAFHHSQEVQEHSGKR